MTDFDPTQNLIRNDLLTIGQLLQLCRAEHGWEVWNGREWVDATDAPQWADEDTYRAKTAPTIMVNGIAVPEPMRDPLADGTRYWAATTSNELFAVELTWRNDSTDRRLLSRGLIHLSEADAITHTRAMCAPGMMGDV